MTRPSQARARRGLKVEAEQLARRGRGRPPQARPPAPGAAAGAAAPAAGAPPVAGAAPEDQGKQFGLVVRGITAPLYRAVCGAELPPAAWEEWGVAAAKFAAYYAPAIALHPGYQFAAASVVLAAPLCLAYPGYMAQRRAQLAKAKAEAAAAQQDGGGPPRPVPPAPPPRPAAPPPRPAPPTPPARSPGHSVGGGWGGLSRETPD